MSSHPTRRRFTLAALAFAGVVGLHLSLHTLVLGLGSVACGLTWLALRRRTRP